LADGFEITNLSGVLRWITEGGDKIEKAGAYALSQVALAVESQAKKNFQGKHQQKGTSWIPKGHITGTPDYPNVRSGNLKRSIRTTVAKGLPGYTATVEPGMIYARNVEVKLGYEFMRPAANKVRAQAQTIFTQAFKRKMGF